MYLWNKYSIVLETVDVDLVMRLPNYVEHVKTILDHGLKYLSIEKKKLNFIDFLFIREGN